jgi:hypothetical protein
VERRFHDWCCKVKNWPYTRINESQNEVCTMPIILIM